MSERSAFIVKGDYRGPNPDAPVSASRAQLYINPQECLVDNYVNTSRTIEVGRFGGGPHGPHRLNRVTATPTEEGCVVEWSLLIGICGDNALAELVCPSIDGRMVLRSDGSGGWTGTWSRTSIRCEAFSCGAATTGILSLSDRRGFSYIFMDGAGT